MQFSSFPPLPFFFSFSLLNDRYWNALATALSCSFFPLPLFSLVGQSFGQGGTMKSPLLLFPLFLPGGAGREELAVRLPRCRSLFPPSPRTVHERMLSSRRFRALSSLRGGKRWKVRLTLPLFPREESPRRGVQDVAFPPPPPLPSLPCRRRKMSAAIEDANRFSLSLKAREGKKKLRPEAEKRGD